MGAGGGQAMTSGLEPVSCLSRRVHIKFASLGGRVSRPSGGWPGGAGNGQEVLCTPALEEALGWGGGCLVTASWRG